MWFGDYIYQVDRPARQEQAYSSLLFPLFEVSWGVRATGINIDEKREEIHMRVKGIRREVSRGWVGFGTFIPIAHLFTLVLDYAG